MSAEVERRFHDGVVVGRVLFQRVIESLRRIKTEKREKKKKKKKKEKKGEKEERENK